MIEGQFVIFFNGLTMCKLAKMLLYKQKSCSENFSPLIALNTYDAVAKLRSASNVNKKTLYRIPEFKIAE